MNHAARRRSRPRRTGLSLLEVLAVVTIMGIIALIAIPRLANSGDKPKANSCFARKGMIEVQAELWLRDKGVAPAADLSDMMSNLSYFPDGAVTCPIDGSPYQLNTTTMTVNGHTHTDLLD
ncbi:MAG TPA: prepilin-type N-terminal cleavage/methylation domain-containing protein [Pirellulaceae bacterium]|nr:prepilin-type N-terminal cleavage/methylation domain-containing protein [Pirellulaceae bacterium]